MTRGPETSFTDLKRCGLNTLSISFFIDYSRVLIIYAHNTSHKMSYPLRINILDMQMLDRRLKEFCYSSLHTTKDRGLCASLPIAHMAELRKDLSSFAIIKILQA